jgi:fibronectin-binding autotransporter adhesin
MLNFRSHLADRMKKLFLILLVITVIETVFSSVGFAATKIWSGAGADTNWQTVLNWVGGSAPSAGDDLVFPYGAARLSNNNNYAGGTGFNSITLTGSGYTLTGNSIALGTGGLTDSAPSGNNTISTAFTLASTITVTVTNGVEILTTNTGVISSTGGIIKAGAGQLTLSGVNTYSTGGTTLNAGILNINNASAIGTGTFTINGGLITGGAITLTTNNVMNWNGNFSFNSINALNLGTGNVTLGANVQINAAISTLTAGGIISGGHSLTIAGAGSGQVSLTGANTYTGGTTINSGILLLSGVNTFNGAVTLNSAGTLKINNASALGSGTFTINGGTIDDTQGSLTVSTNNAINWNGNFIYTGTSSNSLNLGTGNVTLGANVQATVNAGTLTFGGIISGGYSLTSAGTSATLVLSGANTYSGGTIINSGILTLSSANTFNGAVTLNSPGTLRINNASALGTGTFIINGGTIDDTQGTLTLSTNNAINLNGNFTYAGSSSNSLNLGTGNVTLAANVQATIATGTLTFGGVISGGYSLTSAGGNSSLVLSGANTYSGGTIINSGALTLSGANTFNGAITLNSAGTLRINNASALGSSTLIINGGTIDNNSGSSLTVSTNNAMNWNGNFTFTGSSSNGLNLGTGNVTLGANVQVTASAGTLTVGGVISGGYSLTVVGSTGVLLLSGANTYTGGTIINSGTLTLSGANTFNGAITVNSAGKLNINNASALGASTLIINSGTIDNTSGSPLTVSTNNAMNWNGNFTFTGSSSNGLNLGTGNVTLGANVQVTASAGTLTVGGVVSGGYSLSVVGSTGVLLLSGANTYTGGTIINSGTLTLSGANTFNGAITLNSAGTLNVNNASALGSGTLIINSGTINNTSGGTITSSTNNAINWNGNFTYTGQSGSSLNLGTGNVTLSANVQASITSGTFTFGGVISGGYSLTEAGGTSTLALTGANTYTGGTIINAGTLTLSGANTFNGAITVNSAGTLNVNNASALGSGTLIINSGTLNNTSGGLITSSTNNAMNWNGNFTYTGQSGSSLNLGTGNVTLGANVQVTITSGTFTVGGAISDGGNGYSLTKAGASTFALTGASTYSGTTTVNAGTVTISGASGAIASSSAVTVNYGATMTLDNTTNNPDRIKNSAPINLNGGSFNFNGNGAGAASETVDALNINSGASTVTVTKGAGGSTTLTFASFSRTAGATVLFRGTSLGSAPAVNVSTLMFTTPPTLTGGGGAANSTTVSIIAGAIGDNSTGGTGTDMVTYNVGNTNGIRLLNGAGYTTEYASTIGGNTNANVKLTASTAPSGSVTLNSLVLNSSGAVATSAFTVTIGSGNVLVLTGNAGINSTTILGFAANEGIIWNASGTLALGSQVTGSSGVTFAGSGTITISNTSNSYTGTTTVAQGTLALGASAVFTSTEPVKVSGGTFSLLTCNKTTGAVTLLSGTISSSTGILTGTSYAVQSGTISAILAGTGNLTKTTSGTVTLSGANTYTGTTTISAGTISASNIVVSGGNSNIGNAATAIVLGDGSNTGILSNTNTATATRGFTVNAGGGEIDASGGTLTINGNISTTGLLTFGGASSVVVAGDISGAGGSLIRNGSGGLYLGGNDTFDGGITLNSGILATNSATSLGTGTLTINGGTIDRTAGVTSLTTNNPQTWNANFTYTGSQPISLGTGNVTLGADIVVTASSQTLTVGGIISAAHSLTKLGSNGTLVLSGANTFSGGITVNAGTLTLSGANTFNAAVVLNNGTLNINNASAIGLGTLTINGGSIDNSSGSTVTLSTNNVQAWNNNFIFVNTKDLNMGTGNVTLGNNIAVTVSSSTGTGLTVGGIISDGSNGYSLTKNGPYYMTLSGANTFSGRITVNAGTLTLSGANTFNAPIILNGGILNVNNASALGAGTLTINGGSIDNTSGSPITLSTNNVQVWNNNFIFVNTSGLNVGTGNVTLGNNIVVSVTSSTGTGLTVGGIIADGGNGYSLTKIGSYYMTLSGANTFSGGINVNAGTLTLSGANTFNAPIILNSGIFNVNNASALGAGTLTINGGSIDNTSGSPITLSTNNVQVWNNNFTFVNTSGLNVGTGNVTLGNNIAVTVSSSTGTGLTVGGIIADGGNGYSLTKIGAYTLTLSGANTFSGGSAFVAGTLNINNASALGTGTFTIYGGTIDNTSGSPITLSTNNVQAWNGPVTFSNTNNLNLGTGNVTLGNNIVVSISTGSGGAGLTVGGVIADVGNGYSLTKTGAGTLTLSGANTYSGGLNWNNGLLDLNSPSALGTGTFSININNNLDNTSGGAVTLSTNNPQIWNSSFTFTDSSSLNLGTGAVNLGTNVTTTITSNSTNNLTVGGVISGVYGLTTASAGNLILSGNNTFSGGIVINSTKLTLSGANTLSNYVTVNAATLNLNTSTALGTSTVVMNSSSAILDNTSGGSVTLNNDPQIWNANFTFTGTKSLDMGTGAVTMNAATQITTTANTFAVGGAIASGSLGGSYLLTKAGGSGALSLYGNNTFTGGVTLSAGTLNLNSATALGAVAGTLTIAAGTSIDDTSGIPMALINNNPVTLNGSFTFKGTDNLSLESSPISLGNTITATITQGTLTDCGTRTLNGHVLNTAGSGQLLSNCTVTWTGAGGSPWNWSNTSNWGGASVQPGNILVFPPGPSSLVSNDDLVNNFPVGEANFTASGYTLQSTGGFAIALAAAGVVDTTSSSLGTNIMSLPITTTVNDTINISNSAETLTLSGNISGTGGAFTNSGSGTTILQGANTFTGGVTLSSGTIDINSSTALGTGTFTIGGGVIDNTSGSTITMANNQPLTLNGSFTFTGSSNLSLGSGPVTLGNDVTATISNKILTDCGTQTLNGHTLTIAGAGLFSQTCNAKALFFGGGI